MQSIFLFAAATVTLFAAFPYIFDILRGKTKPNIVSWVTWTVLTGTATLAEYSSGEYAVALFTGSATLTTLAVVVLGIKYGYATYSWFDGFCQVLALTVFVFWYFLNNATYAVLAAVMIDALGALPTIRHSWIAPQEETPLTFTLSALGGLLAICAVPTFSLLTLSYPIYILIVNTIIVSVIILQAKKIH